MQALVEFMEEIREKRVRFDPKKLVLTAGSTSANEILMFCLAEPGEAFLIPTPYYPGYAVSVSLCHRVFFTAYYYYYYCVNSPRLFLSSPIRFVFLAKNKNDAFMHNPILPLLLLLHIFEYRK